MNRGPPSAAEPGLGAGVGMWAPVLSLLLAWACLWHGVQLGSRWQELVRDVRGGDFATYYHAVRVAQADGDPYDPRQLARAAGRKRVHPFLYPPPFLVAMQWTRGMELATAHRAWFWMNEVLLWMAGLCLWRWWRHLGPGVAAVVGVAVALHAGALHNHVLGQANLLVLALTLTGLWLAERERPVLAGSFVGLAVSLKLAPLVFVGWWALRGCRGAAAMAVVAIVAAFGASVSVVGWDGILQYVLHTLPDLVTGGYTGLAVGVGMFGNHSLTSLTHALWPPEGPGEGPTTVARGMAAAVGACLVFAVAWRVRTRPPSVPVQVALVSPLCILLPAYGFEHYLVWALPTVVITVMASLGGGLSPKWLVWLVPAWAVWALDVAELKQAASHAPLLAHAKAVALLALLAATASVAPPAPEPSTRRRAG